MGERLASGWLRGCFIASALVLPPALIRAAEPDWAALPYTLHSVFQTVDAGGNGTFPVSVSGPIKLRGVLLNDPEDMLNTDAGAPGFLGGQWQLFIQSTDPGDYGGTALFMGQYVGKVVGNHPAGSYADDNWESELERLNSDADTGHVFRAGDLVEVRARAPGLFHNGKTNINEQHSIDPAANFDLRLIEPGYGLPEPKVLTLSDLKDAADGFLFQQDRLSGPEHEQGTLIRLNDVSFSDAGNWKPDGELTVTDGAGRTLSVKLGLGSGFSTYAPPVGSFDLVGILDQEDASGDNGFREGYRVWLMDYDGNGRVVPEPASLVLLAAGAIALRRRSR